MHNKHLAAAKRAVTSLGNWSMIVLVMTLTMSAALFIRSLVLLTNDAEYAGIQTLCDTPSACAIRAWIPLSFASTIIGLTGVSVVLFFAGVRPYVRNAKDSMKETLAAEARRQCEEHIGTAKKFQLAVFILGTVIAVVFLTMVGFAGAWALEDLGTKNATAGTLNPGYYAVYAPDVNREIATEYLIFSSIGAFLTIISVVLSGFYGSRLQTLCERQAVQRTAAPAPTFPAGSGLSPGFNGLQIRKPYEADV